MKHPKKNEKKPEKIRFGAGSPTTQFGLKHPKKK
jgi:hypothetical protein